MPVTIDENGNPILTPGPAGAHDILESVRRGLPALQARAQALRLREHHLEAELHVARLLGGERPGFAADVGTFARLRGAYEAALASFAARDRDDMRAPARDDAAAVYAYLAHLALHEDAMRAACRDSLSVELRAG